MHAKERLSAALSRFLPRDRRSRAQRGQSLVELALVLPILLVLLAAALDLGRLFYGQITISNAAREGALEAAANPTSFVVGQPCNATTNRVMCRVVNETVSSFTAIAPGDVSLACAPHACSSASALGETVQVTVTGHFTLLTPFLSPFVGGQTITLTSNAKAQRIVQPTLTANPTPSSTPTPTPAPSATPSCMAPTALFSVTPTSGTHTKNKNNVGTTFTFTDQSTIDNDPTCTTTWSWNFGDGSGNSPLRNPTHVYTSAGPGPGNTFTITLIVSVGARSSTYTRTVVVS